MLYVDADNDAAVGLYRALGFVDPPHRPRLRARRSQAHRDRRRRSRATARRAPTSTRCSPSGASRATAPSRSGTRCTAAASRSTTPPRCPARCATASPTRCRSRSTSRSSSRPRTTSMTTQVAVVVRARRRAGRDRAHALPRTRHGVRVVAGRVRDGLHVLRHRPGRVRASPRRRRDRRAGRCAPAHASPAARQQRRVHGHGRAARQLRHHLGRGRTASTTTSGISARRITVSTVGVVPGIRRLAHEDLPVTLAVSLHAPDRRASATSSCRSTAATRSPRCSTPPPSSRAPRAGGSRSSTPASRA